MFERFTERARQVVVFAQDEARSFKHNYIGTEHLLLGLLREEEGIAARALATLGITAQEVRARVVTIVGRGDQPAEHMMPLTSRTKKVLELSLREAIALGHNYMGTEHILLGLVRENEGVASRNMLDLGADAETVRRRVIPMLAGQAPREGWEAPPPLAEPEGIRWSSVSLEPKSTVDPRVTLVVGWLLFGGALAIGIFVGWLIWG